VHAQAELLKGLAACNCSAVWREREGSAGVRQGSFGVGSGAALSATANSNDKNRLVVIWWHFGLQTGSPSAFVS
jgi:hypothetical protein